MGLLDRLFRRPSRPCYLTPILPPMQMAPAEEAGDWVWRIPLLPLKLRFMEPVVSERIVEVPFVLRNLPAPPARVMDFGCTDSPLALELASIGYRVVGVDLRPYGFTHPNLEMRVGDFLDSRPEPAAFDAVVAVSSVEHCGLEAYGAVSKEGGDRRIVRTFLECLKPGGTLLLTVPYGHRGQNEGQRVYDAESLSALLEGFEVREILYYALKSGERWLPSQEQDMRNIDSIHVRTRGAALVRASRPL